MYHHYTIKETEQYLNTDATQGLTNQMVLKKNTSNYKK